MEIMRKVQLVCGVLAVVAMLAGLSSCAGEDATAPVPKSPGGGTYEPPDISKGELTGSLSVARNLHSAMLLDDGRVLVVGGYDGARRLASCEIYNPKTREWQLTASMTDARVLHTTTRLADGRVLVTGGSDDNQRSIYWFEVFDPSVEKWTTVVKTGTETTSMFRSRSSHTASLLPDGAVLVAGGWHSGTTDYLRTYEIYDPSSHTCEVPGVPRPWMNSKRNGHTATALKDGRVLVAGGYNSEEDYLRLCEIYDPGTGAWTDMDSMTYPRSLHTACLLPGGRVFVAGGNNSVHTTARVSEVYDPGTDTWSSVGDFREARDAYAMTLLGDGRVLVSGNFNSSSTEIFAFAGATGTWAAHTSMFESRQYHTMTTFSNDVVLVVGGVNIHEFRASCELYVP